MGEKRMVKASDVAAQLVFSPTHSYTPGSQGLFAAPNPEPWRKPWIAGTRSAANARKKISPARYHGDSQVGAFFMWEVWPVASNTQDGLINNARQQIINVFAQIR